MGTGVWGGEVFFELGARDGGEDEVLVAYLVIFEEQVEVG